MNTTEVILTNQSKDPKPLANQDDSIPYRIDGTKGIYLPTTSNLPLQKKQSNSCGSQLFKKL